MAAHFASDLKSVSYTRFRKYSLMSLQSVGVLRVTSLRSQIKNGKVLWKYSVSSRRAAPLGRSSFRERSLTRSDSFTINLKIRQVKASLNLKSRDLVVQKHH